MADYYYPKTDRKRTRSSWVEATTWERGLNFNGEG